ncbi:MAG TPA: hypothetical protein VG944_04005 [Fimbriimonas sp.]|nr:hypothetical protein [Fimbriimonas sp.]
MLSTIYSSFETPQMAEKAAGALMDYGVKADHLSIIFPNGYSTNDGKHTMTADEAESSAEKGITTTTGGDAASGAAKGAGIGLGVGILAGLASVLVPGVGIVLGGGALALALGGTAASTAAGAVAGGVTGYLKDQGVPDVQAETYEQVLRGGGAIVSVMPEYDKVSQSEIMGVLAKYGGTVSSAEDRVDTSSNTQVTLR